MAMESDTTPSTYSEARPFRCDTCRKGFERKQYLRRHEARHNGKKSYSCGACPKIFLRPHELLHHARVCGIQSRDTGHTEADTQRKSLKSHSKNRTDTESDNVCCLCKKQFLSFVKLERHMLSHTGEKLYQCEICEKRFGQKSHLKTHVRSHDCTCDLCGKKFTSKLDLKNHRANWHPGHSLYPCPGEKYSAPSKLKRHTLKQSDSRKS